MMARRTVRHFSLIAIALAAVLVAGLMSPAYAKRNAFGEITAFDGTMLTVSMGNGGTLVAPVADDVQIKVEHRSNRHHAKHSRKTSNGSIEDLVVGAKIYRIKIVCSEVVKLRISRMPRDEVATAVLTSVSYDEGVDDDTDSNPCDDGEGTDDGDEVLPPDDGGDDVEVPGDDGADDGGDAGDDDDGGLLPGLPGL